MSTTRRRSSRSWMQGISRMRLPMSAKLPAICAIRSANGFGMKCVHASMRIMEVLHLLLDAAPDVGLASRSGERPLGGHRARAMPAAPLSSARRRRRAPPSRGLRRQRPSLSLSRTATNCVLSDFRSSALMPAGAEDALAHRLLLLVQGRAGRCEADAHAALVRRVARAAHQAHRLEPLEQRRQGARVEVQPLADLLDGEVVASPTARTSPDTAGR